MVAVLGGISVAGALFTRAPRAQPETEQTASQPSDGDGAEAGEDSASSGASATMPDVTGLPYVHGRAELRDLGLDVRRKVMAGSESEGTVTEQSIVPGQEVDEGAVVTLSVSDGKETASDEQRPASEEQPEPETPAEPEPNTSGEEETEDTAAPGGGTRDRSGIYGLPRGLLCRDLNARGFSYAAAVDYWLWEEQPDRMDVSGTGRPCTTVYPNAEIEEYWGQVAVPLLPPGMYCRDVRADGYSYAQAVEYWEIEGRPTRMDATGDGTPCTTVYPQKEVEAYWHIRP